jgi:hypothetical protein
MAASRLFQLVLAEMEMDVHSGDKAMVSDFCAPLRVIRFSFPADLRSFCQIFKVAHHPLLARIAGRHPS